MKHDNNPLILIIDDEQAILQTLRDALTDESYRIETLADGNKALDMIGKLIPDLILLDIFMPNCHGLQLLARIKKEYPDQQVIIISGFGNISIAIEAIKKGAIDFIEKPLNLDEILTKIGFLHTQSTTIETLHDKEQKTRFDHKQDIPLRKQWTIIGESNLFLELVQQTQRLAPYRFPILIYGEHGTGKSSLARYIHEYAAQEQATKSLFTTLACDTIPLPIEKLFSSPVPQTIYLKQVDHLNETDQKTLLFFMQQNTTHRIIASSTTSLFHAMKDDNFHESLFYLLNKAPLEVPPLRKRPYDIPLLINHYLSHYNMRHEKKIVFTTKGIRQLRNYGWQGNISELKNVIENIVAQATEDYSVVTPRELVAVLGEKNTQFVEEQSMIHFESLDHATTAFQQNFLRYLLKKNHYNIDQVSHKLNVSPAQLKNQLLELKIDISLLQRVD